MISRQGIRVVYLIVFMAPLTVFGVSANYLFCSLYLFNRRILNPLKLPAEQSLIVAWGTAVFLLGTLVNLDASGEVAREFARSVLSGGAFLAMALLLWIPLPFSKSDLCRAAVMVSAAYAIWVILQLAIFSDIGVADPFVVKSELRHYVSDWPQRFAVLMVFSVFVAGARGRHSLLGFLLFLAILSCLILTFTRAVYLAVMVGLMGVFASLAWSNVIRSKGRVISSIRLSNYPLFVVAFLAVVAIAPLVASEVITAIEKIVQYLGESLRAIVQGEVSERSSVGKRLNVWSDILQYVVSHPVAGSEFSGYYLIDNRTTGAGSAHSQYMDVLLRTGFVGVGLYLAFWARLLILHFGSQPSIFGGLLAVFVYGFVHETTQLTYAGFLIFALANLAVREERKRCEQVRWTTNETVSTDAGAARVGR